MIDLKGEDATSDDLMEMDRLDRLRVATSTKKTIEELKILLFQIQNMDMMQKMLRKRKSEGKAIPQDPTAMQAAMKRDAKDIMIKAHTKMIMKRQEAAARRSLK